MFACFLPVLGFLRSGPFSKCVVFNLCSNAIHSLRNNIRMYVHTNYKHGIYGKVYVIAISAQTSRGRLTSTFSSTDMGLAQKRLLAVAAELITVTPLLACALRMRARARGFCARPRSCEQPQPRRFVRCTYRKRARGALAIRVSVCVYVCTGSV